MPQTRSERGYTLIELLVVVGILSVVAAIATPLTTHAINAATARSDSYRTVSTLRHLQSEAVQRQDAITLAPSKSALRTTAGEEIRISDSATVEVPEPVRFYPDGTTSGGRIILHNGSRTTEIELAWLTGQVTQETP
jgi:general secretion pathway protein H